MQVNAKILEIIRHGLDEYAKNEITEYKESLPSEDEIVDIITEYYPSEDINGCNASRKLAKAIHILFNK